MAENISSVDKFKSNLVILIDIFTEMFDEGYEKNVIDSNFKLMSLLKIVISKTSGDRMLKNFIKKSHLYWDQILNKDIEYFKSMGLELFGVVKDKGLDEYTKDSGDSFLEKLSGNHVELFKQLLEGEYEENGQTVSILDDERKADIWKILHSFVRISIVYIHQNRKYRDGKYNVEFFPEIKVKSNIEKWNIRSIKF
jgi:hypothetical protein